VVGILGNLECVFFGKTVTMNVAYI